MRNRRLVKRQARDKKEDVGFFFMQAIPLITNSLRDYWTLVKNNFLNLICLNVLHKIINR